jgi:hypothetical protein|tara:strand:- start:903 stop:1160 length:258 start_codon:yes stop_codon:yes gene_type:complete
MVFLVLFAFYSLIAGWFVLSILAGWLARRRGRSGFGYFLLSVIVSPFAGIAVVLILGRKGEHSGAPHCVERIEPEADDCHIPSSR